MRSALLSSAGMTALAISLSLVASPASANSTTKTLTLNKGGNFSSTLDLPLFDSNSGTLNSVLVFMSLTSDSSTNQGQIGWASFTSASGSATPAHPKVTTTIGISNGPSVLDGASIIAVTADGGAVEVPSGSGNYAAFTASNTSTASPDAGDLSDWEAAGGGTDVLTVDGTTSTSLSLPEFSFTWPDDGPDVTYELQVTYNYTPAGGSESTPTPEPASILTLGVGLLGLGGLRRRRKRTRLRPPLKE